VSCTDNPKLYENFLPSRRQHVLICVIFLGKKLTLAQRNIPISNDGLRKTHEVAPWRKKNKYILRIVNYFVVVNYTRHAILPSTQLIRIFYVLYRAFPARKAANFRACAYTFFGAKGLIGIHVDAAVFPDISLVAARDSRASKAVPRSFTEELV